MLFSPVLWGESYLITAAELDELEIILTEQSETIEMLHQTTATQAQLLTEQQSEIESLREIIDQQRETLTAQETRLNALRALLRGYERGSIIDRAAFFSVGAAAAFVFSAVTR